MFQGTALPPPLQTVNPFQAKRSTLSFREKLFTSALRAATYAILLFAACIFLDIGIKGAKTLFQEKFPWVNTEFFTESPETLHVFTDESGNQHSLGEREFRAYEKERGASLVKKDYQSYVYGAGGIAPCIVGTVLLVAGCMFIALFLGVFSAIYLSEYSKQGRLIEWVRLAILNLAGVPSIVFGLFGFALFVLVAPVLTAQPEANSALTCPIFIADLSISFQGWGVSLLSGSATLALMILPVIITASEESLQAVPKEFREGALALGATKWQSIWTNVLPYAFPGILTSSILGITRVAGETAPIMFTAAYVVRDAFPWEGLSTAGEFFFQGVMALPYHIYVLSAKIPQSPATASVQYGAVFVLLLIVLGMALASIVLRVKIRKKYRW